MATITDVADNTSFGSYDIHCKFTPDIGQNSASGQLLS